MVVHTIQTRSFVLVALVLIGTMAGAADASASVEAQADAQLDAQVRAGETAELDIRQDARVRTQTDPSRAVDDITGETRDRIRESVNETREMLGEEGRDAREATQQLRREVVDATTEGRDRIRARLEAQRETSYREARDRYADANREYAEARRDLSQQEARGETSLEVRKRVALLAVVQLESYLDMLEKRVESSEDHTAEERERILERTREYRAWLDDESERIEAAQTTDELSGVIGELRSEWANVQAYARAQARQSLVLKISNLFVQSQTASERIEMRIEAVAQAGGNTEGLQALKNRLDARLDSAMEHVREARSASAEQSESAREIAHRRANAARADLSEAYLLIRELVDELRETRVGVNADARADARGEVNV